nr:SURF1 family cytochrome oxidase biogenesis protein [Parvularcula dongshanensis]
MIVLVSLGTWQVRRLAWKEDLIAKVEARVDQPPVPLGEPLSMIGAGQDPEYLPVEVQGGFLTDRTAHVFGTYDGVAGWYVFQPFRPDGTDETLLVNRGFVPDEARQPTYTPPDAAAMTGLVRRFESGRGLAAAIAPPDEPAAGSYFSRRADPLYEAFADVGGTALPFYLDSTLPTALPEGGTTRIEFSNRHLGYVLTWYGLAAALLAVYLAASRAPKG